MRGYSGVHWKLQGIIDTSGHRFLSKTETGLPGIKWETRFFSAIHNMLMMQLSLPAMTTPALVVVSAHIQGQILPAAPLAPPPTPFLPYRR